jgi:hypothetical protein
LAQHPNLSGSIARLEISDGLQRRELARLVAITLALQVVFMPGTGLVLAQSRLEKPLAIAVDPAVAAVSTRMPPPSEVDIVASSATPAMLRFGQYARVAGSSADERYRMPVHIG